MNKTFDLVGLGMGMVWYGFGVAFSGVEERQRERG